MSKYSNEFKLKVVQYCIEQNHGIDSTAKYFNLGHHDSVKKWERIYYEEGPQSLYKERRGRTIKMGSKKKKNVNENEDLLEEVQRICMENEY